MSDELIQYLYGMLYNYARCYGFLVLLPFGPLLSVIGIKAAFAFGLSLLFSKHLIIVTEFSLVNLMIEFVLGLVLSLPMLVLFEFLAGLGEIIDVLRGQTIALQYNPLTNGLESITTQLLRPLLWCFILQAGFMESSVEVLNASFVWSANVQQLNFLKCAESILTLIAAAGASGLQVFLPVALLIITVDLLIVALQTALPQANLVNEAFLLKSILCGVFLILARQYEFIANWARSVIRLPAETLAVFTELVR